MCLFISLGFASTCLFASFATGWEVWNCLWGGRGQWCNGSPFCCFESVASEEVPAQCVWWVSRVLLCHLTSDSLLGKTLLNLCITLYCNYLNNILQWYWQWQKKKKILGMLLNTGEGKLECLCAVFSSVVLISCGCVGQDVIHLLACYPENTIFFPMLDILLAFLIM